MLNSKLTSYCTLVKCTKPNYSPWSEATWDIIAIVIMVGFNKHTVHKVVTLA